MDLMGIAPGAAQTADKAGKASARKAAGQAEGVGPSFGQVIAGQAKDAGKPASASGGADAPTAARETKAAARKADQNAAEPVDRDAADARTAASGDDVPAETALFAGAEAQKAAVIQTPADPQIAPVGATETRATPADGQDETDDAGDLLENAVETAIADASADRENSAAEGDESFSDVVAAADASLTEPEAATADIPADAAEARPDPRTVDDTARTAELTAQRPDAALAQPATPDADQDADDAAEADGEERVSSVRPAADRSVTAADASSAPVAAIETRPDTPDAGVRADAKVEVEASADAAAPREPRLGVEAPADSGKTAAAPAAAIQTGAAAPAAATAAAAADPSALQAAGIAPAPGAGAAPVADAQTPAPMPTPMPTPESQRAAQPVIAALRGREGAQTIEIRLDPPELGRVEIDINIDGDRVTVALRADRDDALDLMRRHGAEFLKELRNSGLDVNDMSFERRGQNGHASDGQSGGRDEAGARWNAARAIQTDNAALAETAQTMAAERSLRADGSLGLDLRV